MMAKTFCVRCGGSDPVQEGLCEACFLATRTLVKVPDVVRVEVCASCGARRRAGSWGDPLPGPEPAIEEEVRERVEAAPDVERWTLRLEGGPKDPTNYEYEALVRGRARGIAFEVRAPLLVHLQRSTCTRCGRRSGGYYESILQLRVEGRGFDEDEQERAGDLIDRVLDGLRASGDLDSFLVKAEEVKGGFDFYLGTVHAGRALGKALAQEMGAALKETASLVGRDRMGTDLYRVTISAKLPRARVGGFVALDDRLHEVANVGPKTATLVGLDDHRRVTRPRADLDRAPVLRPGDAKPAIVVSESERELQVLDPDTLRTVDVVRPPGFPRGRETVQVVPWGGRLWLRPAPPGDSLT